MDIKHKAKIASAHRGNTHTFATKRKISGSLVGKQSNFAGKKHDNSTKDIISDKRGHDDRIKDRKWIVNRFTSKTWRKTATPNQKFQYGRVVRSFREWLDSDR